MPPPAKNFSPSVNETMGWVAYQTSLSIQLLVRDAQPGWKAKRALLLTTSPRLILWLGMTDPLYSSEALGDCGQSLVLPLITLTPEVWAWYLLLSLSYLQMWWLILLASSTGPRVMPEQTNLQACLGAVCWMGWPTVSVGSTILWAGALDWIKAKLSWVPPSISPWSPLWK